MRWPAKRMDELFNIARGGSPRPIDSHLTDDQDGMPWIMIGDTKPGSKFVEGTRKRIKQGSVSKSRTIEPGAFLLTNSMSFGRPYISKIRGCIHDGWLVLERKSSEIDDNYFFHVLNSQTTFRQFERLAAGATVKNLNKELVAKVIVPLPPLDEQRRIAAMLDQAEELRTQRRAAIALLDQLPQAIFLEMFGDPTSNPKGWETKPLKQLTTKIGSGSTPTGGESAYKASGVALIRSMNVYDGQFVPRGLAHIDETQAAKLSNVIVAPNDVLLNITGASVARVALVPGNVLPARVNQHVSILRCAHGLSPRFLEALLMNSSTKKNLLRVAGAGATREAITKEQLESFEILLPPTEMQGLFADRVEAIHRAKSVHLTALASLDGLFSSLQNEKFGGAHS